MHWESYPISGLFPTGFSFLFHGTVDLNAFLLLRVEALDAFDFGQFYNDRISMATQKVIKVYINAGSFIVIDIEIQSHACAGRMVMVNICSRKLGPQVWG